MRDKESQPGNADHSMILHVVIEDIISNHLYPIYNNSFKKASYFDRRLSLCTDIKGQACQIDHIKEMIQNFDTESFKNKELLPTQIQASILERELADFKDKLRPEQSSKSKLLILQDFMIRQFNNASTTNQLYDDVAQGKREEFELTLACDEAVVTVNLDKIMLPYGYQDAFLSALPKRRNESVLSFIETESKKYQSLLEDKFRLYFEYLNLAKAVDAFHTRYPWLLPDLEVVNYQQRSRDGNVTYRFLKYYVLFHIYNDFFDMNMASINELKSPGEYPFSSIDPACIKASMKPAQAFEQSLIQAIEEFNLAPIFFTNRSAHYPSAIIKALRSTPSEQSLTQSDLYSLIASQFGGALLIHAEDKEIPPGKSYLIYDKNSASGYFDYDSQSRRYPHQYYNIKTDTTLTIESTKRPIADGSVSSKQTMTPELCELIAEQAGDVQIPLDWSQMILPVTLQELMLLSPNDRDRVQVLLINIPIENNNCWLVCSRSEIKKNAWTVYYPKLIEPILSTFQFSPRPEYYPLDYSLHTACHQEEVDPVLAWNVVALGRVLPWAVNRLLALSSIGLEQFRAQVPYSLLKQLVYSSILPLKIDGRKTQQRRELKEDFVYRSVVGNRSLTYAKRNNCFFTHRSVIEFLAKLVDEYGDHKLLLNFDKGIFQLAPQKKRLETTQPINVEQFFELMLIAQDNPLITGLAFKSWDINAPNLSIELFSKNTTLLSLEFNNLDLRNNLIKESSCISWAFVARNRFLKLSLGYRNPIMSCFNDQEFYLRSLDAVEAYLNKRDKWRELRCDFSAKETLDLNKAESQLLEITEMGLIALNGLVQEVTNSNRQGQFEPLNCLFDLSGPAYWPATDYMELWLKKIDECLKANNQVYEHPFVLFNRLDFILPNKLSQPIQQRFNNILIYFNKLLQLGSKNALTEITLYQINLDDRLTDMFLDELLKLVRQPISLQVLIKIPALDRIVDKYHPQLVKYRQLQNLILNNQRAEAVKSLDLSSYTLSQAESEESIPRMVSLERYRALQDQPWPSDSCAETLFYPLETGNALGIEQQLQAEAQEQQEQQEQEEEQYQENQEQKQSVDYYPINSDNLITRDLIDIYYSDAWGDEIIEKIRNDLGLASPDLSDLFSLWVGSFDDAEHIIKYIESQAVEVLRRYYKHVQFGLNKDNLPAGFFLARHDQESALVLGFSQDKYKLDLKKRPDKPNPFTLKFYEPWSPVVLKGDFRQFNMIHPEVLAQQTLWRYLATEDDDTVRLDNSLEYVKNNYHIDADQQEVGGIVQAVQLKHVAQKSQNLHQCIQYLRAWSTKLLPNFPDRDDFFDLLFSSSMLNEANLKAWGQLFNGYDPTKSNYQIGTAVWLKLAYQIYHVFGEEYFKIWKESLLDPSKNWIECVQRSEVEATVLSLGTLKDSKFHSFLWWQIVKAHGRAIGVIRYADLWYAFQELIEFCEEQEIDLQPGFQKINAYLDNQPHFNGIVFLERIHTVLKESQQQLGATKIRQHIINHVTEINWLANGFCYAVCYEGYPAWDNALELEGLKHDTHLTTNTYRPDWDNPLAWEESSIRHALRFVFYKKQLDAEAFDDFKQLLNRLFESSSPGYGCVLRLMVIGMLFGVDKLNSWLENPEGLINAVNSFVGIDSESLKYLNTLFLVNTSDHPSQCDIRFADIPDFVRAVQNAGLMKSFRSLQPDQALRFLNACGRILHCGYDLGRFLNKLAHQNLAVLPFWLETCPWVLDESDDNFNKFAAITRSLPKHAELNEFCKQLQAIDLDVSLSLPSCADLQNYFYRIINSPNPSATRHDIVSGLMQQKCIISYQNTLLESPNDKTMLYVKQYLDETLRRGIYKEQNFALCVEFIQHHAALSTDINKQIGQIQAFVHELIQIDNKPNYNELTRILVKLRDKAKGTPPKRFSLPQLTEWLALLKPNSPGKHYPVNLLNELVDSNYLPTLLNQDLYQLELANGDGIKNSIHALVTGETTLSDQVKLPLLKLIIRSKEFNLVSAVCNALRHLQSKPVPRALLRAIAEYACSKSSQINPSILSLITELPPANLSSDTVFATNQMKLIELLNRQAISDDLVLMYLSNPYVRMIIMNAIEKVPDKKVLFSQSVCLEKCHVKQLAILAYYQPHYPALFMENLQNALSRDRHFNARNFIHEYEASIQAENKRHYSLGDSDRTDLMRILQGFKLKGSGPINLDVQHRLLNLLYYANVYSQASKLHNLNLVAIAEMIQHNVSEIKNEELFDFDREKAKARVLACMREVLLRKRGLWVNHTQMLDTLYMALYDDKRLLHQVRTGQGKSILTFMSACYQALLGRTVDIFSAKESLSLRDHEEFLTTFDALGVKTVHITPQSKHDAYQQALSDNGFGCIHYATPAGMHLHALKEAWSGTPKTVDPSIRVAIIDEVDHILLDDKTEHNFSDKGDSHCPYAVDEWLYRATYEFYCQNATQFERRNKITIVSLEQLKQFCSFLQEKSKLAPIESEFVQDYLLPALRRAVDGTYNQEAIQERNEMLVLLLSAAHASREENLKESSRYSILPDQQILGDDTVIDTRAGFVLIGNQISTGSTYSNLVQQLLHVRLNDEALKKQQPPDFFIKPYSRIALSLNATYGFKNNYHFIQGYTGTAGDQVELKRYEEVYDIKKVIKLPRHEISRTHNEGMVFCDTETSQITKIIEDIIQNPEKTILITCEDDIAVKHLSRSVKSQLSEEIKRRIIVDTNDSGNTEKSILEDVGKSGAVTFSSRLGRGTDIKPEGQGELYVIRTYNAINRITEQEFGRQGRNGAIGSTKTILNYGAIKEEYEKLCKIDALFTKFQSIYEQEEGRLNSKLAVNNPKFTWLHNDPEAKQPYLISRTLAKLNSIVNNETEQFQNRKHYLIAFLSTGIAKQIETIVTHQSANLFGKNQDTERLKKRWLRCRKKIESLWNACLAGKTGVNEALYDQFIADVIQECSPLFQGYDLMSNYIFQSNSLAITKDSKVKVEEVLSEESNHPCQLNDDEKEENNHQAMVLNLITRLYQTWNEYVVKNYLVYRYEKQYHTIFEQLFDGFDDFYLVLNKLGLHLLNNKEHVTEYTKVVESVMALFKNNSAYCISCACWVNVLEILMNAVNTSPRVYDRLINRLDFYFSQILHDKHYDLDSEQLSRNGDLILLILNIAAQDSSVPDKQYLQFIETLLRLIKNKFSDVSLRSVRYYVESVVLGNEKGSENIIARFWLTKTNINDITLLLQLLLKSENENDDHCSHRFPSFLVYQKENCQFLDSQPEAMVSLLKLAFLPKKSSHLPDLNFIDRLGLGSIHDCRRMKAQWLEFLSRHEPVEESSHHQLTEHLSAGYHDPQGLYVKRLWLPLISLPPHIPLQYIAKYSLMYKHYFENMQAVLEDTRLAGTLLNQFMLKRDIVKNYNEYGAFESDEHYGSIIELFSGMDPERNKAFFSTDFSFIPIEMVMEFGRLFSTQRINVEQLHQLCELFVAVKHKPLDIQQAVSDVVSHLFPSDAVAIDPSLFNFQMGLIETLLDCERIADKSLYIRLVCCFLDKKKVIDENYCTSCINLVNQIAKFASPLKEWFTHLFFKMIDDDLLNNLADFSDFVRGVEQAFAYQQAPYTVCDIWDLYLKKVISIATAKNMVMASAQIEKLPDSPEKEQLKSLLENLFVGVSTRKNLENYVPALLLMLDLIEQFPGFSADIINKLMPNVKTGMLTQDRAAQIQQFYLQRTNLLALLHGLYAKNQEIGKKLWDLFVKDFDNHDEFLLYFLNEFTKNETDLMALDSIDTLLTLYKYIEMLAFSNQDEAKRVLSHVMLLVSQIIGLKHLLGDAIIHQQRFYWEQLVAFFKKTDSDSWSETLLPLNYANELKLCQQIKNIAQEDNGTLVSLCHLWETSNASPSAMLLFSNFIDILDSSQLRTILTHELPMVIHFFHLVPPLPPYEATKVLEKTMSMLTQIVTIPDNGKTIKDTLVPRLSNILSTQAKQESVIKSLTTFQMILDHVPDDVAGTDLNLLCELCENNSWEEQTTEKLLNCFMFYRAVSENKTEAWIRFKKEPSLRRDFMELLRQGIFDQAGIPFKETCYQTCLALYGSDIVPFEALSSVQTAEQRHGLFKDCYQNMVRISREMASISKPSSLTSTDVALHEIKSKHKQLFAHRRCGYESCFWRSGDRIEQSSSMFADLEAIIQREQSSQDHYYHEIMQRIINMQKQMIESDKNTKRNKKGYSRLYDIGIELLLITLRDGLLDERVTLSGKNILLNCLNQQRHDTVLIFKQRLKQVGHGLAQSIEELEEQYQQIGKELPLTVLLNEIDGDSVENKIPRELMYLTDAIRYASETADSPSLDYPVIAPAFYDVI